MLGVVIGGAGCDPNVVHRHQPFHEWRGAWRGSDEDARPVAEPQAQHHGIEYALLITRTRYFVAPFPLAARATIPAPRPRRTRTLRRLAIPAVAATTPNAAVDHGRRSRIYRSCLRR